MPRMRIWICKKFWNSEFVKKYPKRLFIFGDNEAGWGTLGQACIRPDSNSIGIPTQKRPARGDDAHWNDSEYERNCNVIDSALIRIIKCLRSRNQDGERLYEGIVLPGDGLGTGLAGLPWRAPKTFKYLKHAIRVMNRKIFLIKQ